MVDSPTGLVAGEADSPTEPVEAVVDSQTGLAGEGVDSPTGPVVEGEVDACIGSR